MKFEYNFDNDYYKYFDNYKQKCTKYKILAPE